MNTFLSFFQIYSTSLILDFNSVLSKTVLIGKKNGFRKNGEIEKLFNSSVSS